ncbi:MAG: response regulator [Pseudomonadota bacterium]
MPRNSKVLVVDDEASVRRQLSVGLTQKGFSVEECGDGLTALRKIEAAWRGGAPYSYVVLDMRLPDINGLKILQVVRCRYPDLPIVMISGYGNEHTRKEVVKYPGSTYLDKPFEMDALEAEFNRIASFEKSPARSTVAAAGEPGRMQNAFVFIRARSGVDMYTLVSRLYFADGVLYCDAVRGDWDIVVLVQAADKKGIHTLVRDTIESLDSTREVAIHCLERPWLDPGLESFIRSYEGMLISESSEELCMNRRAGRQVSAYAVVEIDPGNTASLFARFCLTDGVVHCDVSDGGSMIVLFLQAADIERINELASSRVRNQPGVREARILNIVEIISR